MSVDDEQTSALLDQTAKEPAVIAELSANAIALQAIQLAKRQLADLPTGAIRAALGRPRRHAVLDGDPA